jgi:polar amino acid transport system substrate-binding protein
MNKIIFFFIVLTVLSGAQVTAGGAGERRSQDPIHVVIATDATYPPMTFLDDSGEIVGFEVDLMNAAAEAGGFTCEFKNTPWDYIFTGLANGEHQAVMSSVTITEDRKSKMDFSIPYLTMEQILVMSVDSKGIERLEDLSGQVVGILAGSAIAYELAKVKDQQDIEMKTYYDNPPLIDDFVAGRLAAIVIDSVQARLLGNDPRYSDTVRIVSETGVEELYGVVVKKNDERILKLIDAGLGLVLYTDTYKQIVEKWLK